MSEASPVDESHEPPSYVLHPLRGVVWGAFWGSFIGAAAVLAMNYWRIGWRGAARNIFIAGVVVTLFMFILADMVPEEWDGAFPLVGYPLQLVLAYSCGAYLQRGIINQHAIAGGQIASAWWSIGLAILSWPVLIATLVVFAFTSVWLEAEPSYGTKVTFGNDDVYYSGEATEQDARDLAKALTDARFFGRDGVSVRIEAANGNYIVSFMLVDGAWQEADTVDAFRMITKTMVPRPFPAPLKVQLCGDRFSVKKTFTVE